LAGGSSVATTAFGLRETFDSPKDVETGSEQAVLMMFLLIPVSHGNKEAVRSS